MVEGYFPVQYGHLTEVEVLFIFLFKLVQVTLWDFDSSLGLNPGLLYFLNEIIQASGF